MGKGAERRRKQKERRIYEHGEGAHLEAVARRKYQAELIAKIKNQPLPNKVLDPLWAADPEWEKAALSKLEGRVVDPKNPKPTDKIAARPPAVYYVIVGRGPAAICNHTTLRQSAEGRKRVGDLPVVHIGHPDPWGKYFGHGMGQPPYLLGLPGFQFPPDDQARLHRGRCHSEDFAAATENEWQRLAGEFPGSVRLIDGAVLCVQKGNTAVPKDPQGREPFADLEADFPAVVRALRALLLEPYPTNLTMEKAPFRVAVVLPDGQVGFVYAKYVDFCSGAGRPTPLVGRGENPPAIVEKVQSLRAPPWLTPGAFWTGKVAPMLSGNEALLTDIAWPKARRVASYGAGGVGLNMVERAEDEGIALDWISEKSLLGNGMLLNGNVPVLYDRKVGAQLQATDEFASVVTKAAGATGQTADTDREAIERRVGPFGNTVRFIRKAALAKARLSADESMIALEFSTRSAARCVDRWEAEGEGKTMTETTGGNYGPLTPRHGVAFTANYGVAIGNGHNLEHYGRLIWTIGQEGNSSGNPKSAAGHLGLGALTVNGLIVGLSAQGGAIRVLGACAQAYPQSPMGIPPPANAVPSPTQEYFLSLPISAVPPGFIFSGACIAIANQLFPSGTRNPNVNTMTKTEMQGLLTEAGAQDGAELTRRVLLERRRLNGFATVEDFWNLVVQQARLVPADAGADVLATRADDENFDAKARAAYPVSDAKLSTLA